MAKPTKAERAHMARVKEMPCIICDVWPVDVHHANTGMGRKKNHMKVLPLCFDHHRGENGLGTLGKKTWESKFGTQDSLLSKLEERL